MTRAAIALAKGDLDAASRLNPTALVTVPVAAALCAFFLGSYLYDGRLRPNEFPVKQLAIGVITILDVVWIARITTGAFGGLPQ